MAQIGDTVHVGLGPHVLRVGQLRHDLDLDRSGLEIRRDPGELFWLQIRDGDDDDPGAGAIDMSGDVGDRPDNSGPVVAQMPFRRVVVEDADGHIFVVRILRDHIECKHPLVPGPDDDRRPGGTGRGEAALSQIAPNPVLEALDDDHHRACGDGNTRGDEQLIGKGKFDHPHDTDAHGNGSHDRSELISRPSPVAAAVDPQRSADEEDDERDRRADEHARCVDEMSMEVVPHECHRHVKECEDESIDE